MSIQKDTEDTAIETEKAPLAGRQKHADLASVPTPRCCCCAIALGVAVLASLVLACFGARSSSGNLDTLFSDRDIHKVVTANILKVGEGFLDKQDALMVMLSVSQAFSNVSASLQEHAEQVAIELGRVELNATGKEAILTHMRLLVDDRVHSFGVDVGAAIRDSPTPDHGYLERHIEEHLRPRKPEIADFAGKELSATLMSLWGRGRRWSMSLDQKNIRSMEPVSGEFVEKLVPSRTPNSSEKEVAVKAGALEQATSLLDVMLLRVPWPDSAGPSWATNLDVAFEKVGGEPLSWPCQLSPEEDIQIDFDKGLVCPLKFGAMGLDAVRALAPS